jgi:uncharacterized membrane protein YeaQ/YmgE (transglycosylase-associated protein family)
MRDPYLRPRRGMNWKTRAVLYLIAAVVLLCIGAWLGSYVLTLFSSVEFILFAVIGLIVLVAIVWIALSLRGRGRRR